MLAQLALAFGADHPSPLDIQPAMAHSLRVTMASAMPKTPLAAERRTGRNLLQFGGAFGGALLTSGSFTMMAASGGF